jgi:hypothetical protein
MFATPIVACALHVAIAPGKGALEIGHLRHRRTRLTLTRRFAPPSPTRRGRTINGFHATPLPLCHETSAVIRGSLPRPRGEGGRSGGRVRVNPRESLLKMSKLQSPRKGRRILSPGSSGGAPAPQRNPGTQSPQPFQTPPGVADTHGSRLIVLLILAFSTTSCFPPRAGNPGFRANCGLRKQFVGATKAISSPQ